MNNIESYIPYIAQGESLRHCTEWLVEDIALRRFAVELTKELGADEFYLEPLGRYIYGFKFGKNKPPRSVRKTKGQPDVYRPALNTQEGRDLMKRVGEHTVPTFQSRLGGSHKPGEPLAGFYVFADTFFIFVPRSPGNPLEPTFTPLDAQRSSLSAYYAFFEAALEAKVKGGEIASAAS